MLSGDWGNQGVCWEKLVKKLRMHARGVQEGTHKKNVQCSMCAFRTYIVWCQMTHLHGCWRNFWHIYTSGIPFCDMIVQMSEYSLMGKYSLVVCCTLIMYSIIDGRYIEMEIYPVWKFYCSYLSKIPIKRKCIRISDHTKPVRIMAQK